MPRLAFQPLASSCQEYLDRGGDVMRRAGHLEADFAVLGQPVALTAQFFQLLRPERLAQQFLGVARRVEAGADVGLQQAAAACRLAAALR